jgi:hypothetical protein
MASNPWVVFNERAASRLRKSRGRRALLRESAQLNQ